MSVDVKCKFASLKYEQLLSDKYFVETCFSKKYDSYPSREKLRDMYMSIDLDVTERCMLIDACPVIPVPCVITTTTTTTTTTTSTTTTTTCSPNNYTVDLDWPDCNGIPIPAVGPECVTSCDVIEEGDLIRIYDYPNEGDEYCWNVAGVSAWDEQCELLSAAVVTGCGDCPTTTTTTTTTSTTTTTTVAPEGEVTICSQGWKTVNFTGTTYANGDPIPEVTNNAAWAALTTGAWCWYNNDAGTGVRLYNWYAVNDIRGLAPVGWHVPTNTELATLSNCLGGDSVAGGFLKEAGLVHWDFPNSGASNTSGFTGLSSGYRWIDGVFITLGTYGYFWSATEAFPTTKAYYRFLKYNTIIFDVNFTFKEVGFPVRLIKD